MPSNSYLWKVNFLFEFPCLTKFSGWIFFPNEGSVELGRASGQPGEHCSGFETSGIFLVQLRALGPPNGSGTFGLVNSIFFWIFKLKSEFVNKCSFRSQKSFFFLPFDSEVVFYIPNHMHSSIRENSRNYHSLIGFGIWTPQITRSGTDGPSLPRCILTIKG